MPLAFCICLGCSSCPPGRRSHTYDKATSQTKRCSPCQVVADRQHEAQRGTTAARGYGTAHQRKRAELVAAFIPGQPCARCGRPMDDAAGTDLDHDASRTGYLPGGLSHSACNRGASSKPRRTARMAKPKPDTDSDKGEEWAFIIA